MSDVHAPEHLDLPVLPLTDAVLIPGMVVTLSLDSDEARALGRTLAVGDRLLVVPRTDGRFASVGAVASVEVRNERAPGRVDLVVHATGRARLGAAVDAPHGGGALWLRAEPIADDVGIADQQEARRLADELRAALRLLSGRLGLGAGSLGAGAEPGVVADLIGFWPALATARKVELLETVDVMARLTVALSWVTEALAEAELGDRIRSRVSESLEGNQRRALLQAQLAAIRAELGEGEADAAGDPAGPAARLDGRDLPEAVRAAVDREVERLARTSEQSPEHAWIRAWLDAVADLPWGERSVDGDDLGAVRAVLDADHAGLDEVKERIVEDLAVRRLRLERGTASEVDGPRSAPTILLLVGPPGVGKTSLGESVARALGRRFARVALGGVHDEAEIRGHRRTYVGARPGRIVRALVEAGTMNPVLLLDEIDKVGADWRGDPAAALLEVLDPAQNHTFRDHYLELDLDLSDVLVIATANQLDTIPPALADRLEVVALDGYTEAEKVAIARDHLLGRVAARAGLRPGEVEVTDAALARIVSAYTREAGVRSLERALGRLVRKAAAQVAAGGAAAAQVAAGNPDTAIDAVRIDEDDLVAYLGRARFEPEPRSGRTATPGVATGLAVTGAGGDVLFVEATALDGTDGPGDAGLTVTGQLGDVMRESATIARSYVRSHAGDLGLPPGAAHRPLHLHVPAGAVPKDGPSAGVTMTTALVSLLSGRPVRADVGMTGEVTLSGRVLPVGGIKQKLLAAHRAGLREVLVPARNAADLDDVPDPVLAELTVHLVEDVAEVVRRALTPAAAGSEGLPVAA